MDLTLDLTLDFIWAQHWYSMCVVMLLSFVTIVGGENCVKKLVSILFLVAAHSLASCQKTPETASDVEGRSALVIKGKFFMTHYKGNVNISSFGSMASTEGKLIAVDKAYTESQATEVDFDINSEGFGTIAGWGKCTLSYSNVSTSGPADPNKALDSVQLAFAAYSAWKLVMNIWKDVDCATMDKLSSDKMVAYESKSFFGAPETHLWANVGVMGETKDIHIAERECSAMRGVRYVLINGARACVGYTDAKAQNLKMLMVRPSEIYAQRLLFKRAP